MHGVDETGKPALVRPVVKRAALLAREGVVSGPRGPDVMP